MSHRDYKKTPLGKVLTFNNGKSIKAKEHGNFPVFGSNGIIGFSDEYIYQNAIILGRVGAYCGSVEYCPKKFWASDNTIVVYPNNDKGNIKYYYYLLAYLDLHRWAGGAAQPLLTQNVLKEITAPIADPSTQRKIASILSAYDDLIENNTRRIQILEEMAQGIYKEWFVHFRFPGYEKVKMVEIPVETQNFASLQNRIPEGWEVRRLGEVTSLIKRGISPKYDDYASNTVINQRCIRDFHLNLSNSRRNSKKVPSEKLVLEGDVLINSTGVGTLGRMAQVQLDIPDCTVDSHVTIVRPSKNTNSDFFGLQLLNLQPYFERQGKGATGQTELGGEAISNAQYLNPPLPIQMEFSKIVQPIRSLAIQLDIKNEDLRHTRDLLLPKLISGEIDVKELDIITGTENGL